MWKTKWDIWIISVEHAKLNGHTVFKADMATWQNAIYFMTGMWYNDWSISVKR